MARTEDMTMGEEQIAFFVQVGQAITEWALVEQTLFNIAQSCFENKNDEDVTHRALAVGFFSIEGFRAKMDFTEGLVDRWLQKHNNPARPRWRLLVKRVWAASAHRNKLAHWPCVNHPDLSPGRRFLLVPRVYRVRKTKSKKTLPPDGAQGLRDIWKMRAEFVTAAVALEHFSGVMLGKAQSPEPPVLPERPPTIAKLRGQILVELARLLQPSQGSSE
jgi:hypothetical protein